MDTLRANIRHLIGDRSELEVGERSKVGQSWLHRFMKGSIHKPNAIKVGQLAAFFGVSAADLQHVDLTQTTSGGASQSAGQERQIVAAAVKLVQYLQDVAVEPLPPGQYPDLLYVAMQVARDEGAEGILDGHGIMEASKRFAARLRTGG